VYHVQRARLGLVGEWLGWFERPAAARLRLRTTSNR